MNPRTLELDDRPASPETVDEIVEAFAQEHPPAAATLRLAAELRRRRGFARPRADRAPQGI